MSGAQSPVRADWRPNVLNPTKRWNPAIVWEINRQPMLWMPDTIEAGGERAEWDTRIRDVPDRPAVFAVWPREGSPYLARTTMLRRRLNRLLGERSQPSRLLNLRAVASRVEYQVAGSWLEMNLVFYEAARRYFPDNYLRLVKLRMPPYIKVILSNRFPRSQVTTRLGGARAFYYGPFRTRASAELFESRSLDLFQMRRCPEDLEPSPQHPGCMYGEMGMCLRPCQQAVTEEEYHSEVVRVTEFLASDGRSLLETISHLRDKLSEEMDFEEAGRQHKRLEKILETVRLRDELAHDIERLNGVAVTKSSEPGCAELWFVLRGCWQRPQRFGFEVVDGKTVSLDHRLRNIVSNLQARNLGFRQRQEHLALLARWFYSSSRDGEWVAIDRLEAPPYRRIVNAIVRVAKGG